MKATVLGLMLFTASQYQSNDKKKKNTYKEKMLKSNIQNFKDKYNIYNRYVTK